MADLVIPDLDDGVHAWLEQRAREHNRTVVEEAREALRSVAAEEEREGGADAADPGGAYLVELATRLFGPENGFDLELPSRREERVRPPPDFSGPEYDR